MHDKPKRARLSFSGRNCFVTEEQASCLSHRGAGRSKMAEESCPSTKESQAFHNQVKHVIGIGKDGKCTGVLA